MVVNYNLVVDFARPSKSNTILIAEDDANSRNCRFTLLADKQPFDMTNVTTAVVQGILPSGSVIIDEATIEQDDEGNNINVVDYLVPNAFAETPGTITLTISLNDNLGARITSFEFYLKVRNALYNEDDYINDDDLDGFRDLLARSQAALEKMEQMTENDALPNPYPIRVEVDGVEYEYKGDELVEIYMGDVAYLGEVSGTVEITEDDSAAQQAIHAAEEAAESAQDCASKLDEMTELYNTIDAMVPTANVQKDYDTHKSIITITDRNGTTTAEVIDGMIGNSWYVGTALAGTGTGVTGAPGIVGDFYVNSSTFNVYNCVVEGDISTAEWDYLVTMNSGGGTTYDAGLGIDITNDIISVDMAPTITSGETKPVSGGTINTKLGDYYTKSEIDADFYDKDDVDEKLEVVVKYAGKKSFSELTSSLLAETYENNFFMLSNSGYITSANINLWNDNFVVGDHIMTDSHIAVVKYTGSTAGKGTYVFDDFGGFVEVDEFTSLYSPVGGVVTFPSLNPNYGYKLFADIPDESQSTWPTSASDLPKAPYTKVQRSTNADGTINLAYTVTNTSLQYALRIFK